MQSVIAILFLILYNFHDPYDPATPFHPPCQTTRLPRSPSTTAKSAKESCRELLDNAFSELDTVKRENIQLAQRVATADPTAQDANKQLAEMKRANAALLHENALLKQVDPAAKGGHPTPERHELLHEPELVSAQFDYWTLLFTHVHASVMSMPVDNVHSVKSACLSPRLPQPSTSSTGHYHARNPTA